MAVLALPAFMVFEDGRAIGQLRGFSLADATARVVGQWLKDSPGCELELTNHCDRHNAYLVRGWCSQRALGSLAILEIGETDVSHKNH